MEDDGVDEVAELAKMRSRTVPGGLAEPEQRNTGIVPFLKIAFFRYFKTGFLEYYFQSFFCFCIYRVSKC